jgi:hypothetical protein
MKPLFVFAAGFRKPDKEKDKYYTAAQGNYSYMGSAWHELDQWLNTSL